MSKLILMSVVSYCFLSIVICPLDESHGFAYNGLRPEIVAGCGRRVKHLSTEQAATKMFPPGKPLDKSTKDLPKKKAAIICRPLLAAGVTAPTCPVIQSPY